MPKRKEAAKKVDKKVKAPRAASKSVPKVQVRKRDQKAALKVENKVAKVETKAPKVKRSATVQPRSSSKAAPKADKVMPKVAPAAAVSSSKKGSNSVSPPK